MGGRGSLGIEARGFEGALDYNGIGIWEQMPAEIDG